jgi:hypothetical protein
MGGEKMESDLSTRGLRVEVRAGVGSRHRTEGCHEIAFAKDLMDLDLLVRERDAMTPHVSQCFVQGVNDVSSAVVVMPVGIQAPDERGLVESGPGNESATDEGLILFC